jgi:mannose-6-phosphate isomerase
MTAPELPLLPIQLEASLHETLWGGRNLAAIAGKALPPDVPIGESWETEIACLARNAPYTGRTLGELVDRFDERLLGPRAIAVYGHRFPLLAKFIDARQWLSVQVHPDDEYAALHEGGKLGKTETWYILHAEPEAKIVYGLAREAARGEVRDAIAQTRLEQLLRTLEVRAGDVIFVPAGTVHAIGGGIALYELQEYSDVTYRLYDYGRLQANGTPRELHVERSLDVMRYGPAQATFAVPVEVGAPGAGIAHRVLVACRYFVEEEIRFSGPLRGETGLASCQILSVLDGAFRLQAAGVELCIERGDTVVLPAAVGAYTLIGEQARVLRSYVPEERDPNLQRWCAAQPVPPSE